MSLTLIVNLEIAKDLLDIPNVRKSCLYAQLLSFGMVAKVYGGLVQPFVQIVILLNHEQNFMLDAVHFVEQYRRMLGECHHVRLIGHGFSKKW
jgi:hypothetical protein